MSETNSQLTLLYGGPDWLAVDKPAGLETVDPAGRPSLTTRLRRQLADARLAPVHRLDRDTTGVVLFGKTPEAVRRLEDWFRRRLVHKTYLALCLGFPRNRDGIINRPLSRWRGGHRPVSVVTGGGGLPASTRALRLAPERAARPAPGGTAQAAGPAASFMAFEPREGRTHQIRVHAAAFGHPILGDDQYGDRPANHAVKAEHGLARQALHAWRIVTPEGAPAAPPPPDFRRALEGLLPGEDWAGILERYA